MHKLARSFVLLALFSACGTDDLGETAEPDTNGDLALNRSDVVARPSPRGQLPAQCDTLQEVAATLLASYRQCSSDAECGVAFVNADCLSSFMCPVPVNKTTDVERLRREADALSFAYQKACTSTCPVASCAAAKRIYCDPVKKRCVNDI